MLKFNAEKAEKQIGLLDVEQPYEFEKSFSFSGEWGIRTRGCCYTSTVFKTAAIDHSANSPAQKYKYHLILQILM